MMRTAIFTFYFLIFTCAALAAEAPDPRLQKIAEQKKQMEDQAERGRLLIENAQLRFKLLTDEEARIKAEAKPEASKK